MKIPLSAGQTNGTNNKAAQMKALERDLVAVKKGDWNANKSLIKSFKPLLTSLAQKRTEKPDELAQLIEVGQEGLLRAAKKFKLKQGPSAFQFFALDYIENSMDGKPVGFFGKLFGKG